MVPVPSAQGRGSGRTLDPGMHAIDDPAMSRSTVRGRVPSWSAVADWRMPSGGLTWAACVAWAPAFGRLAASSAARLAELLGAWDEKLANIGEDPARQDWSRFRPLRLSREEDWSDWLGHLLERSRSGRFPARLLAGNVEEPRRWLAEHAEREVVAEGHRADLVVHFRVGDWAHIEVKAGDLSLAKTPGTGLALRRALGAAKRGDFLLLPREDVPCWGSEQRSLGPSAAAIEVRTWHDVARALRLSALEATHEDVTWRVWAVTFAGAIEQKLLGFLPVPKHAPVVHAGRATHDLALVEYLEGLEQP